MLVIVPVVSLAYLCDLTTVEAGQTMNIIQDLAIERFDHFGDDVRNLAFILSPMIALIFQLDLISLQSFHQNIEFTASRLFKIDLTLVYGIIGAITTYLVILLQFSYDVIK